jgi:hypothetical protein
VGVEKDEILKIEDFKLQIGGGNRQLQIGNRQCSCFSFACRVAYKTFERYALSPNKEGREFWKSMTTQKR